MDFSTFLPFFQSIRKTFGDQVFGDTTFRRKISPLGTRHLGEKILLWGHDIWEKKFSFGDTTVTPAHQVFGDTTITPAHQVFWDRSQKFILIFRKKDYC
jgi:hypothetical protein